MGHEGQGHEAAENLIVLNSAWQILRLEHRVVAQAEAEGAPVLFIAVEFPQVHIRLLLIIYLNYYIIN